MWMIVLSWILVDHTPTFCLIGLWLTFSSQNNFLLVWLWQNYNHYHAHREHMPKFDPFGPNVWLWCLDTYIQTYIHTYKPKYILKWVCGSNSLGPILSQNFLFLGGHFFSVHTNGKWCSKEGSHPCYSQSQFVCAYHVLSLSHKGFVWPNTFFFCGPDMKTEMGVVIYMYLKHFPDHIDSKYIWVHDLTSKVQVFLLIYHFWHF